MIALLWKDWRIVRPLLIAAGVLYLVPALISAIWGLTATSQELPQGHQWYGFVASLLFFGCMAAVLATPMFPAVMFARERRERTAELAATMPIRRGHIVLSKAIVALGAAITPWAITTVLFTALYGLSSGPPRFAEGLWDIGPLLVPIAMCVMGFGLGWLLSTLISSETYAAAGAWVASVATLATIVLVQYNTPTPARALHVLPYVAIMVPIGVAAFAAGTAVALKRVSP
jgi:ABC-type transport system involved in multi-copper enzyme maturation permease subunit